MSSVLYPRYQLSPMKHFFLPAMVLLVLAAVAWQQQPATAALDSPQRALYYWRTNLAFDATDRRLADAMDVDLLYLRYFDVDWSDYHDMPVPVAPLQLPPQWPAEGWGAVMPNKGPLQLCPVVFITNRVFLKPHDPDKLARQVGEKVAEISRTVVAGHPFLQGATIADIERPPTAGSAVRTAAPVRQLQIDCDWTEASRADYFAFLSALKRLYPQWQISCTVRMHQYKESGLYPPVDRAVLMCYNLAAVEQFRTRDAIFDTELLATYLQAPDYPLPLDLALPLFSWGAVFRDGRFRGLARAVDFAAAAADPNLVQVRDNRFRFLADTTYAGMYVRAGDEMRIDEATAEELMAGVRQLKAAIPSANLIFFDWNPQKIQDYGIDQLWDAFYAP